MACIHERIIRIAYIQRGSNAAGMGVSELGLRSRGRKKEPRAGVLREQWLFMATFFLILIQFYVFFA